MSLIGIYSPRESIENLLLVLSKWDLSNPNSEAYQIGNPEFDYVPLPLASCLYAIGKSIYRYQPEVADDQWLLKEVMPVLKPVIVD